MINSVFGKTMEHLKKRICVELIDNAKDYVRCVSRPSFVSQKIFSKHFVAVHRIKPVLTLNKPSGPSNAAEKQLQKQSSIKLFKAAQKQLQIKQKSSQQFVFVAFCCFLLWIFLFFLFLKKEKSGSETSITILLRQGIYNKY